MLKGYDLEEIESVADTLIQLLDESEVDQPLSVLALCLALVKIADDAQLGEACITIDRLAEAFEPQEDEDDDSDED